MIFPFILPVFPITTEDATQDRQNEALKTAFSPPPHLPSFTVSFHFRATLILISTTYSQKADTP